VKLRTTRRELLEQLRKGQTCARNCKGSGGFEGARNKNLNLSATDLGIVL